MGNHTGEPATAACLVEALSDDPFYSAITVDFPEEGRRRGVLRRYFEYSMEEGGRLGTCTVLPEDGRGVAIWTKPASEELACSSRRAKHLFLESILGRKGLENYDSIIGFMSPRSHGAAGKDAWYLSILGVEPQAQGRGLGRRLLEPTLSEADREGAVCFLETYSSRSIPFYERLGFRRVASHVEPVTSSEYWIMVRERTGRRG